MGESFEMTTSRLVSGITQDDDGTITDIVARDSAADPLRSSVGPRNS